MGKKKNRKGGDDDDDEFTQLESGKGYVSLQEVARREGIEADKEGTEEPKPSKKNKKKGKGGADEENDDKDVIAPKRNKKGAAAKEDDAAFEEGKEESKGDGEVIGGKAAAKDADSGSDDDANIAKQKADHFVGVDSKNTRKKKKQEGKMQSELLAGAFDEDAEEDEVHEKKGKQKASKKQQEKEEKRAAMKAAKKSKKKQQDSDESEEDGDDKNEEDTKEEDKKEGEDDGGVFKDIGKQFGKGGSKKKGKKDKKEAEPEKQDPPEESKVADAKVSDDEVVDVEPEYPLNVIYCGKCSLPPEYCSFGQKDTSACKAWLQDSHPVLARELYGVDEGEAADGKAKTAGTADKEEQKKQAGSDVPEETKGEEGAADQPKAQKKKIAKNEGIIHVYKLKRGGKKIQCLMTGWDHYHKDLKALCTKFQKKFSCGASTAQDEQYGACIQVQGDIEERLLDYIEEDKEMIKMEIPIEKIVFEEKGNKKGRKKH